ncbi:MAG TPA: hypothetical protein ENH28_00155 [Euryarchaeota archaeon]|nr:hypothetical protein [Euryarchaeota archaeon]
MSVAEFLAEISPEPIENSDQICRLLDEAVAVNVPLRLRNQDYGEIDAIKAKEIYASLNERDKQEILKKVNKEIYKNIGGYNAGDAIEDRLDKYGKSKDIEVEIVDFVEYNKNSIGIKVYIGGNMYLFNFDGNIEELEEYLKELVDVEASDKIKCPFCGTEYVRSALTRYVEQCVCGAVVVTERARDAKGIVSHESSKLWEAGCQALRIPKPKNWEFIFIDEYFTNVRYAGHGTTTFRTWFCKTPWEKDPAFEERAKRGIVVTRRENDRETLENYGEYRGYPVRVDVYLPLIGRKIDNAGILVDLGFHGFPDITKLDVCNECQECTLYYDDDICGVLFDRFNNLFQLLGIPATPMPDGGYDALIETDITLGGIIEGDFSSLDKVIDHFEDILQEYKKIVEEIARKCPELRKNGGSLHG